MKTVIALLALASVSTALARDEESYDFKGVPLGTPLEAFRTWAHPDGKPDTKVACTGDKVMKIGRSEFTAPGTDVYDAVEKKLGVTKCVWVQAVDDKKNYRSAGRIVSLAFASSGYAAYEYSYSFIPDPVDGVPRLYQVVAISNRNAFADVVEALTTKYGEPEVTTDTVQNKMGATFPHSTAVWTNEEQSILAEDRFTKIDNMVIMVTDHRLAKPIKEAEEAEKAKQVNPI